MAVLNSQALKCDSGFQVCAQIRVSEISIGLSPAAKDSWAEFLRGLTAILISALKVSSISADIPSLSARTTLCNSDCEWVNSNIAAKAAKGIKKNDCNGQKEQC